MTKEEIKIALTGLITKARYEKKLIRSRYQGIVLMPSELEAYNASGQFLWGLANWDLVDPGEELANREYELRGKTEALVAFRARVVEELGKL